MDVRSSLVETHHYSEGMQTMLKENKTGHDFDKEAVAMAKLVKSICKVMFDYEGFECHGCVPQSCQNDSYPPSMKLLVSVLHGAIVVQKVE